MSRRHRYDYSHKPGSGEGLRRDIRRRRWMIGFMLLAGFLLIGFVVYLSLMK